MAAVFLSYPHADSEVGERLAEALRAAGHSVWFDEWAVNVGDSIVQRIDDGLTDARYLVLCCTAAGVDSPWVSREWMSGLARQMHGHDVKLLPALFDGGGLPAIIGDLSAAAFWQSWTVGLSQLLRAIR